MPTVNIVCTVCVAVYTSVQNILVYNIQCIIVYIIYNVQTHRLSTVYLLYIYNTCVIHTDGLHTVIWCCSNAVRYAVTGYKCTIWLDLVTWLYTNITCLEPIYTDIREPFCRRDDWWDLCIRWQLPNCWDSEGVGCGF